MELCVTLPEMNRQRTLDRLRASEDELRAMGVLSLSMFGSVARGEASAKSDVDLAARLDHARKLDLLDFAVINERLSNMLGLKVDLVSEPTRRAQFQAAIDRDRVHVF
jgi:uncharacterized protein